MNRKRNLRLEVLEQRQMLDAMSITPPDTVKGIFYAPEVPGMSGTAVVPVEIPQAEMVFQAAPLAASATPEGYDAHDFAAAQNFLNQSDGTQTNAQILSVVAEHEVDPNDPGTWFNKFGTRYFEFAEVEGTKFLTVVGGVSSSGSASLEGKGLVGELDVSGCTSLTAINIGSNHLTNLNTTGCTALTDLTVSGSQLGTLDVSEHTKLTSLFCANCNLTTLDVSALTDLGRFGCGNNQLTELDVTNNTKLTFLSAEGNQLTRLDLRNLDATSYSATIGGNSDLALLIKSGATPTVSMFCAKDGYSAAFSWSNGTTTHRCQYSGAPLLGTATYTNNADPTDVITYQATVGVPEGYHAHDFIALYDFLRNTDDVTGATNLSKSGITDFSDPTTWPEGLAEFTDSAASKQLKSFCFIGEAGNPAKQMYGNLNFTNFTALETVDFSENRLETAKFTGCTSLTYLGAAGGNYTILLDPATPTETLTLSAAMQKDGYTVTYAWLDGTTAAETTFAGPTSCITTYAVNFNVPAGYDAHDYVTVLDFLAQTDSGGVTNAAKLGITDPADPTAWGDCFVFAENTEGVKVLTDVGNNDSMEGKELAGALDLSGCAALVTVNVENNALTSIDVSGCTALEELYCSDNQLTALDLAPFAFLMNLTCANNQLTELDLTQNAMISSVTAIGDDLRVYLPAALGENTFLCIKQERLGCDEAYLWTDGSDDFAREHAENLVYPITGTLTLTSQTDPTDVETLTTRFYAVPAGYAVKEYLQMVDFLETETTSDTQDGPVTKKNGLWLNENYSSIDPATWTDVTFAEDADGVKHVETINFDRTVLGGVLDCSGMEFLTSVVANGSQLTSVDFAGCTALEDAQLYGCKSLETLNLTDCTALEELSVQSCKLLTELDVSDCAALMDLNAAGCAGLTTLDLSANTALEGLNVSYTNLTVLDLRANAAVNYLEFASPSLKIVYLSEDLANCTLDASYNENDGTSFLWKNAGTSGCRQVLTNAKSVPEICTITPGDGVSFTTQFLLREPIYQDGSNIVFGFGIEAQAGETYTFMLKISSLPDYFYCWQRINASVDEYGLVTAAVNQYRFWNDWQYDIRIVDSKGNILKEDVFTATRLAMPLLQIKPVSTTQFQIIPLSTDARASDYEVSYRLLEGWSWGAWETTKLSDLIEQEWVKENPDGTYLVTNLPAGAFIQFQTCAEGEYSKSDKTLYLDSFAVLRNVYLPQPAALARVYANAVATNVDALTLNVTKLDQRADGVQYRWKVFASNTWSEWTATTDTAIQIDGITPGTIVQIQIFADTSDPINFKASPISTVYCILPSNRLTVPMLRTVTVGHDSATLQIMNWTPLNQLLTLAGSSAAISVTNGVSTAPVVFTFNGTSWKSETDENTMTVNGGMANLALGNLTFNTNYTFKVEASGKNLISAVSSGLKIKTLNVN